MYLAFDDNDDSVKTINSEINAEVQKALEDFTIERGEEILFVFDDPHLEEEGLESIEVCYDVESKQWIARSKDEENHPEILLLRDENNNYYFDDEIDLFDSVILTRDQFQKFESIVSKKLEEQNNDVPV